MTNLKEEMEDMEQRLSKKVDQERKERMDDVSELRADIDKIVGKNESVGTVPSLVGAGLMLFLLCYCYLLLFLE